MTASYYGRRGSGHSRRGAEAREHGARAWSRLPARLRRGICSGTAETLGITREWHHAGKYAAEVRVYYPHQVDAYWRAFDEVGCAVEEAVAALTSAWAFADPDSPTAVLVRRLHGAADAAEHARVAHLASLGIDPDEA